MKWLLLTRIELGSISKNKRDLRQSTNTWNAPFRSTVTKCISIILSSNAPWINIRFKCPNFEEIWLDEFRIMQSDNEDENRNISYTSEIFGVPRIGQSRNTTVSEVARIGCRKLELQIQSRFDHEGKSKI